tara:strand:+ start:72 stop:413 length:342 start_codon:yes stop_codon:yes gene_type:complete
MNIPEVGEYVAKKMEIKTEMGLKLIPVVIECIKLFDKKQEDYGSKNIAAFTSKDMNMLGVLFRTNDKVQRLLNLIQRRIKDGTKPNNESIQDNAMDVANYGLILMMLESDIWE